MFVRCKGARYVLFTKDFAQKCDEIIEYYYDDELSVNKKRLFVNSFLEKI